MGDPFSIVVKPLVDDILKDSFSLAKEDYLLIKNIEEKKLKLQSCLTTIQSVLVDAEEKQLHDKPVRDWLEKLLDASFDAEDALNLYAVNAFLSNQKKNHLLPKFLSGSAYKHAAAKKIDAVSSRIDQIAKEKEGLHLDIKVDVFPDRRRVTGSIVDESSVVGRDVDKENIIKMLLSDEFDVHGNISVLPISGMGGLGKTTLAQIVFNDDRLKDHFKSRMWVCVTANFDLTRILREMVEYHSKMQVKQVNLSLSQLQDRLLEFLRGNRFLLVLDDVWTKDEDDWNSLLALLRKGGRGSKILVTSRIMAKLPDSDETLPTYQLEYLPEDKCRSLFEKIAFRGSSASSQRRKDLENLGQEIVRKCKGLPLAVKVIAGLLRDVNSVSEWEKILANDMWKVEELDNRIDKPKILPALKLSYDYLPSYLKRCFAYCSIFPKAFIFQKEELVKIWKGENLIQNIGGGVRTEEIGIEYFDELLVRSFFQLQKIDKKERFVMHDLMHDLSQSISSPLSSLVKENNWCSSSEKLRYVSLICKDVEQPLLKIVDRSKKVRTLLMPSVHVKDFGVTILDKVFRSLKYLRTLDLSSSTLTELPESIGELKLLRYLDVSKTEIRRLPDKVCDLYSLQTLKLLQCPWLIELPKGMGKLVNLEHLDLDGMFWFKCLKLPPGLGQLTRLRNLNRFHVNGAIGQEIEQLKCLSFLTGTLRISKLENAVNAAEAKLIEKDGVDNLMLEWSETDMVNQQDEATAQQTLEGLQPQPCLKQLKICHYKGSSLPSWLRDGVLQNLVTISLRNCKNCRVLNLGELPNLQKISVKGMQELERAVFNRPSLRLMKFNNCPKLRELPEIVPNLTVLKIKYCNSLSTLPLAPSLMFLTLINNLILDNWNEQVLRLIFEDEQGRKELRFLHSFINLLELKVVGCPKLQGLPMYFAPQKLEIIECELLRTLPSEQYARRLQHLAIDGCQDGTMVRKIPSSTTLFSLVISNISNIASFPKWPSLPGLKALYIHGCKDLVSLSEGEEGSLLSSNNLKLLSVKDCPKLEILTDIGLPTALENLKIAKCPMLKSLGPKEILKNLRVLHDLYIEDCQLLHSLPEDGLPNSLQHLLIEGCSTLSQKCQEGGPYWPAVMDIPDLEID